MQVRKYSLTTFTTILRTIPLAFIANLFMIVPAWALQTHSEPEGIYVHQMAHLLFMAALAYLSWDIRRTSFSGRGWGYMQLFCLSMFLWNVLAFTGHGIEYFLGPENFLQGGYWHNRLLGPMTMNKQIYYLAKLDHLVCVPALFFLFLSLRTFYRDSLKHDTREGSR
ncbi:MAG: hypothetical protein SCH71_05705 [Desulfobulbaceae bacterium]|nr:hypothetical protein [Desulfobulbaceae bacterium]